MRLTHLEQLSVVTVGVAALAATLSAFPAHIARDTEHFDQTVAFPSGGTLQLHNFSGDVHITGTTGKDVVIKAERRADRDQLEHIKLVVKTSGSTVIIEANERDASWDRHKDNVVETTFDIQVPSTARLDVDAFSSDLDVKGVAGAEELRTFSGGVTVDATAAGTAPKLFVNTFSGDVRVRLAGGAKGDVSFESFSGRFDTELPLTIHEIGRRYSKSASRSSGSGDSDLSFNTFSGSVRVVK